MDMSFMMLNRLAFGYWESQPLYVMAELGLFDLLGEEALGAPEIAAAAGVDESACIRLLDAGVALKLLRKEDGRYRNAEAADRFLSRRSPESLYHWVLVMGRWTAPWTRLADAVRSGRTVEPQGLRLGGDPAYMRDFILGMHEYARRTGAELPASLPLDGVRRVIDVGGGAGTYSIALCRAVPEIAATVLDLPPVLEITREVVAEHGLQARISTASIDYRSDPFGTDADLVLLSNILHQEAAEVCRSILARARDALKPGGRVVVQGHFLNEDRTSPTFTTLHNLSALALWEGGSSRTLTDMAGLVETAGFEVIDVGPVGRSGLSMVVGLKA